MPYVYTEFKKHIGGPLVGNGSCALLIQMTTPGLKGHYTREWRAGKRVLDTKGLIPGTAIATFENGRYPERDSSKHAAFFLAYGGAGFYVVDQWANDKDRQYVGERYIHPARLLSNGTYARPSNSSGAFYVIELK